MSRWLELTSQIKRRPPEIWMTPTQQAVLAQLEQWLMYPDTVNVYGDAGVGKTYLAWALARRLPGEHVIVPERMGPQDDLVETIIVDNAPYTEQEVRRVLAQCSLRGANTVVLITRRRVALRMGCIELTSPTLEELRQVERNLANFSFQDQPVSEGATFWQVINSFV